MPQKKWCVWNAFAALAVSTEKTLFEGLQSPGLSECAGSPTTSRCAIELLCAVLSLLVRDLWRLSTVEPPCLLVRFFFEPAKSNVWSQHEDQQLMQLKSFRTCVLSLLEHIKHGLCHLCHSWQSSAPNTRDPSRYLQGSRAIHKELLKECYFSVQLPLSPFIPPDDPRSA